MVGPTELESVTSCVSSRRSNQLSYGPRDPQYIMRTPKIRKWGTDAAVRGPSRGISLVSEESWPCHARVWPKAGRTTTIQSKIFINQ